MRVLIQRVKKGSVSINNQVKSLINKGLVIFIGVENTDTTEDVDWLTHKIVQLRIFDDEKGVMNKSVLEMNGEILVVSQFTLFASTRKGNRPSYIRASKPEISIPLYNQFCDEISKKLGKEISTGEFGVNMQVEILNDGPVTIWMDSKNKE